jgi:alpha-mannosidase
LHDIEFLYSTLTALSSTVYPRAELDELWQLTLLNQFHDVIPGTSIPEVFADSAVHYKHIQSVGNQLVADGLSQLAGSIGAQADGGQAALFAFNSLGVARQQVVELPAAIATAVQVGCNGKALAIAEAPSYGWREIDAGMLRVH